MVDKNDWRITNQGDYLMGATFYWREYKQPSKDWDHDHCKFCFAKFMEIHEDDVYNEGYITENHGSSSWVCKECFDDFKEMFSGRLETNHDKLRYQTSEHQRHRQYNVKLTGTIVQSFITVYRQHTAVL